MPVDATLTKIERNLVLQVIQQMGLDASEFEWRTIPNEDLAGFDVYAFTCSELVHRPTGFYFLFGGYRVRFSPGSTRKVDHEEHRDSWDIKGRQLALWLGRVKGEHEAPDLWAAVERERELGDAAASSIENSRFTADELPKIQQSLGELKAYLIAGIQLQAEQAAFVEHQFRYLEESSRRFGRKDWLMLLYGTLVSMAVAVALPADSASGLLRLAGTLLHGLWDGIIQRLVQ